MVLLGRLKTGVVLAPEQTLPKDELRPEASGNACVSDRFGLAAPLLFNSRDCDPTAGIGRRFAGGSNDREAALLAQGKNELRTYHASIAKTMDQKAGEAIAAAVAALRQAVAVQGKDAALSSEIKTVLAEALYLSVAHEERFGQAEEGIVNKAGFDAAYALVVRLLEARRFVDELEGGNSESTSSLKFNIETALSKQRNRLVDYAISLLAGAQGRIAASSERLKTITADDSQGTTEKIGEKTQPISAIATAVTQSLADYDAASRLFAQLSSVPQWKTAYGRRLTQVAEFQFEASLLLAEAYVRLLPMAAVRGLYLEKLQQHLPRLAAAYIQLQGMIAGTRDSNQEMKYPRMQFSEFVDSLVDSAKVWKRKAREATGSQRQDAHLREAMYWRVLRWTRVTIDRAKAIQMGINERNALQAALNISGEHDPRARTRMGARLQAIREDVAVLDTWLAQVTSPVVYVPSGSTSPGTSTGSLASADSEPTPSRPTGEKTMAGLLASVSALTIPGAVEASATEFWTITSGLSDTVILDSVSGAVDLPVAFKQALLTGAITNRPSIISGLQQVLSGAANAVRAPAVGPAAAVKPPLALP